MSSGYIVGNTILQYTILRRLGEGGMGVVYLARDSVLDRVVALKFLSQGDGTSEEDRARFLREARAASAINHPNVCTIYTIEQGEQGIFISMEYVDGVTLRQKCTGRPIGPADAIGYALQIASALEEAHRKGVIHRDIKSDNILLNTRGQIKVMDFGLARITGASRVTRETGMAGSLAYMSPEQIQGADLDQRTDLWSLGVVLYEMLAGMLPFRADHEAALMYMILHTEPEGLGREVPGEPAGLQDLLRLLLEKDRSRRLSSATDVLRALRTMAEGTEAPGSASAARRQQSIAVLPLANLSPDPENEFFSDGMTEEIAASLSRLRQLRVCSRSMSLQYKGKLIDPRTVGRDLAVDFIVEGSVRRIGTRVRMNVELTDTRTGFQVWAQSYDRQIEDVFAVQDEVSRTIADSLKLHLTGTDHDGLRRKYTANPAAYDEYLRGRFLWNKRRREDVLEAIAHYRNAMNIDSSYTLAYTGIAICYSALSNYGWMDSSEARRPGTEALERAIDLEPDLDEVHMVRGEFAFTDSDLDEADRHYRRAIQQNPSNAVAHHWYAYVHLCRADFQTALYENDAALQLEPLSPIINAYRGFILFCQGNFREAHECMSRAVRFDDTFGQGHHLAAWVLAWMDQYPEALESVSRGERAWGDNNHLLCVKAVIQARQGDREGAGDVLAQLARRREEGVYVHPFDFALVHAAMGDADAMFRNLREACDVRFYWWFVTLKVHPVFAPYREDFRFREILTLLRLK